jgi:hypothetical protein
MSRLASLANPRSSTCFGEVRRRGLNAQRAVLDWLRRSPALCLVAIALQLAALIIEAPALRFTPKADFVR